MAEWRLFTERDWHECALLRRTRELEPLCWAPDPPRILAEREEFARAVGRLDRRIRTAPDRIQFEHGTEGKIPRAHVKRTYRLTDRGAILAATTLQHSQAFDLCEVDVFLAVDVPGREPLAAVRALVLFLLTDAVKCGGSLAVQFTRECSGVKAGERVVPQIPKALRVLAEQIGVRFEHAAQGLIAPNESRELYLRLTPFSPEARNCVRELSARGVLSVERVCYLLHHGIWSLPELELLLLGSPYPELILGRAVVPEDRHRHAQATTHARGAILAGVLARALAYRDPLSDDATAFTPSCEPQAVSASVRADLFAQVYKSPEPLVLTGWRAGGPWRVSPNVPFTALLRPWTRAALLNRLENELKALGERTDLKGARAVVVPFEYYTLPDETRKKIAAAADNADVGLLVCPEKLAALSNEAARRLMQGRNIRK